MVKKWVLELFKIRISSHFSIFTMSQLQTTYILISALSAWTLILSFYLVKAVRRYTKLTKGANNVDLGRVLEDIIKRNQKNEENVVQISKEMESF